MQLSLKKLLLIIIASCTVYPHVFPEQKAFLTKNSLEEINSCQGKLELKLIRIWGGAKEEDEMKFFENPESIAVGNNGHVYICDQHGHCIKEFSSTGEYVRTIGRRGKGPGDVLAPHSLTLSPRGDLLVLEMGGVRLQYFNNLGKSTKIIKTSLLTYWLGVTSQNKLIIYDKNHTFNSRKLLSVMDCNGVKLHDIGQL